MDTLVKIILPPRVFPSTFTRIFPSPPVVYRGYLDFLVMLYIYGVHPHCPMRNPSVIKGQSVNQKNICKSHRLSPKISLVVHSLFLGVY